MTTPYQLNGTLVKDTDKYKNKKKYKRNNKSWKTNGNSQCRNDDGEQHRMVEMKTWATRGHTTALRNSFFNRRQTTEHLEATTTTLLPPPTRHRHREINAEKLF